MKSSTLEYVTELAADNVESIEGEQYGGMSNSGYKSFDLDGRRRLLEAEAILKELLEEGK